ncbi:MAG: hypothetical protein AAF614_11625 [Chloroflexota bacterium]
MKQYLILILLLLAACAAPAVEPVAEPTEDLITVSIVLHFFDDVDETTVPTNVYIDDQLMCEEMTSCEIEFTRARHDEAAIPFRFRAEGYSDLDADMTDTLNQGGTLVLTIGLTRSEGETS